MSPDVRLLEAGRRAGGADLVERVELLDVDGPVDLIVRLGEIMPVEEVVADGDADVLVEVVADVERGFRHDGDNVSGGDADVARLDQQGAVGAEEDRAVRLRGRRTAAGYLLRFAVGADRHASVD